MLVKRAVALAGERGSVVLGLLLAIAGFILFGASRSGLLFWLGIPLINGMSFVWPAAQSIMTRGAAANEQGQLQGAIHSLRGISGLLGPGLFTYIFSKSIGAGAIIHLPGSPFYMASGLLVAALVVSVSAFRKTPDVPSAETV